jgi:hypothetical protein
MADFREEQHFEQFWTPVVFIPAVMIAYGIYRQASAGALLWPALAVTLGVAIWFSRMKLVTEVRDDGLFIWFVWLWPQRTIPWEEIRSAEPRIYRPIRDFGGWGVRWAARGIVYHARGKQGVRLVLESGERVLIGSQHADDLARAIGARTGRTVPG